MSKLLFLLIVGMFLFGCISEPPELPEPTIINILNKVNETEPITLDDLNLTILTAVDKPPEKIPSRKGYELFYDGKSVGYEPEFDPSLAYFYFKWNKEQYPDINVTAFYDDEEMQYSLPLKILPVFIVPSDVEGPTSNEVQLVKKHLVISQTRYKELLRDRDTFEIAFDYPIIYKSSNDLVYFKRSNNQGIRKYLKELLPVFNATRHTNPYVFVVILMNPYNNYPRGAGGVLNGGPNHGSGIVVLSSYNLDSNESEFQSALQHELGHSFGLQHIDEAYGYDQSESPSIMSYNQNNSWSGFTPPRNPGILIPEELQVLSQNKNVFPNLYFDPEVDIPKSYEIKNTSLMGYINLTINWRGYRLFYDGILVKQKLNWNSTETITDLFLNIEQYPEKNVTGTWGENQIIVSGKGYEVYYSADRMIYEPGWTFQQAVENFVWYRKFDPSEIIGVYNGKIISE